MPDYATLYYCDPEKNTECKKRGCAYIFTRLEGGVCCATLHREYARTDEKGNPVEYKRIRKIRT